MTNLVLTQYLYNKHDVELMILFTLLKRDTYKEVLFWASEYIHSGYCDTMWKLLWVIYFDMYALKQPFMYKYIFKKHKLYNKTKKPTIILDVLKNLYYANHNHHIFEFRMALSMDYTISVYRGRKPLWLNKYKQENHNLIRSIHKRNGGNTAFYFNRCRNYNELFEDLKEYNNNNNTVHKSFITTFISMVSKYRNINTIKLVCITCIYLLCISVPQYTHNTSCKKYIQTTNDDVKLFYTYHKDKKDVDDWMFIKHACIYPIQRDIVNIFNTTREGMLYRRMLLYNWEYYAYTCPLWLARFNKYEATIDEVNKRILFNNTKMHEEFNDLYDYELEEQDINTQKKVIIEYNHSSINVLFELIWGIDSDVLDNNIKYHYLC